MPLSGQGLQAPSDISLGAARLGKQQIHREKSVDLPRVTVVLDGYSGFLQAPAISFSVRTEQIAFAGDEKGRRQSSEILCKERRNSNIGGIQRCKERYTRCLVTASTPEPEGGARCVSSAARQTSRLPPRSAGVRLQYPDWTMFPNNLYMGR